MTGPNEELLLKHLKHFNTFVGCMELAEKLFQKEPQFLAQLQEEVLTVSKGQFRSFVYLMCLL